ncbi:MAG: DUF4124 domain-containing protein [Pseudomonadales bacterium]|nr:DUF4124 domain-containing protein [Gammaproteobacteria bacterium]MBP6482159.1 DUF4124 domain-containing protein [Pseudomonadales bacterium]MBP7911822.1 DUF4124 domain-containing protein [Pseudomonadales bacterium]
METARTTRTRCGWMLAIALAAAVPALGATVYRTVDAEGRVSFSDTPPPPGSTAEVIKMRDTHAGPDPEAAERLQQMRETTDRLREDRLAREQERALPPAPAYPGYPEQAQEERARHDETQRWLLPYYPPYRRWPPCGGGHGPRPRPPCAEPEPLPSGSGALSPRGLKARLREAR